jgi:hypothetical protein
MTATKHRITRPGDRMIERLQSIMLEGATLVATVADVDLYATPSGRFFTFAGGDLRPITQGDALALTGGQP